MDLLLYILIPLLFLGYAVYRVVSRGSELRQLLVDGIESTGTVVSKHRYAQSGALNTYIHYEYRDQYGRLHKHRSLVPSSVWSSLEDGAPIAIVYSHSRPHISAPRYLVEQGRRALEKKGR